MLAADDPGQAKPEVGMNLHCGNALLLATYLVTTALAAAPASGQTATPTSGAAQSPASIPDFSGIWRHPSLPGFEPPPSGPGPVTNRSRRTNTKRQPGASDYDQLVGDYTNPILKPHAAETVKKFGEISLRGITYSNPAT